MTSYDMSDIQEDLITFSVFVVRRMVNLFLQCRRLWSSPDIETMKRTCHITSRVLTDGDAVPNAIVLETWTRGDRTKAWVQYAGETIVDHDSPFDTNCRAPWFWIGYKTISGDMIDLTSDMAPYVVPGNTIKPDLIHALFPRSETGTLVYIEPSTFEIKDLSSDGLVIGDSDDESIPPPPPSPTPEHVPASGDVRESSEDVSASRVD